MWLGVALFPEKDFPRDSVSRKVARRSGGPLSTAWRRIVSRSFFPLLLFCFPQRRAEERRFAKCDLAGIQALPVIPYICGAIRPREGLPVARGGGSPEHRTALPVSAREDKDRIKKIKRLKKKGKGELSYLSELEITWADDFNPYTTPITPEIAQAVLLFRGLQQSDPITAIRQLPALIDCYPEVPVFKNILFMCLAGQKRMDEAWAVNDRAIQENPGYLLAQINKASEHYNKGNYAGVLQVFGDPPILSRSFPARKVFHGSEVVAYESILVYYYLAVEEYETALSHYYFLEELAPGHPSVEALKIRMKNLL